MHVAEVNAQRIPTEGSAAWPVPESVAIVGPGYFPDVASAAYLLAAERVVVAVGVQYSRQSLQNRCRIRTPDGAHWLTIPLRGSQHGTANCGIRIDSVSSWQKRHRKAFEFNYRSSPYFDYYDREVWRVLAHPADYLTDVTVRSIQATAKMLGSEAVIEAASGHNGIRRSQPQSWTEVVESVIESHSDANLLLVEPWVRERIGHVPRTVGTVGTVATPSLDYEQNFPGRISGLTVLDAIFNLGPETPDQMKRLMTLCH